LNLDILDNDEMGIVIRFKKKVYQFSVIIGNKFLDIMEQIIWKNFQTTIHSASVGPIKVI